MNDPNQDRDIVGAPAPRDAAAVPVFPPVIPLAAILVGIGLGWLWPIDLGLGRLASPFRWIGGALILAALLLGATAIVVFRRSGESEKPWEPTSEIIVRGPFRFTRNPLYLQLVLICLGLALVLRNIWILLLTPIAAGLLQRYAIRPEEKYLERKFGETYLAYKRRVRRWM